MPLLLLLVRVFIDFFGITRPTAAGERRAAVFIATLMLAIVLATVAFFAALMKLRF